MQVSDLVEQYNNAAGQLQMTGTTGVKKLASSLRELGAGNIFEGTVNSMKNGQVVLGLTNGQTLTARVEGKVSLSVGQSMFFQVKSNNGSQIAIRPFTMDGSSVNLTLSDALKAAGLLVDARSLSMVNVMMEEQMSIDKNSLSQMARVVQQNPDTNVGTLVQMQKLGISITPEFTSQFENYLDDRQAIGKALDNFMQELPQAMAGENLSGREMQRMGADILSIVTEGLPAEEGISGFLTGTDSIEGQSQQMSGVIPQEAAAQETAVSFDAAQETATVQDAAASFDAAQGTATAQETATAQNTAAAQEMTAVQEEPYTLGSVLDDAQIGALSDRLSSLLPQDGSGEEAGMRFVLKGSDGTAAVLNGIRTLIGQSAAADQEKLSQLFSSKEFQTLVKDAMEQQWLLRPEELGKGGGIGKLYEKLEDQLSRMENVVKASGQNSESISQLASDIRSNISFMDEINQHYTYVQIPLKMSGQNASGELYVYTNKKSLEEGTKDITAFLHLDMDHLGPTDVSVRLHGMEVFTNFYFDDDKTYELVEAHIPELEARLEEKGYKCSITVVNDGKQVNFVEDFLKKDQPSAGLVHRYSFDMRA